jgi:hypothetical protein
MLPVQQQLHLENGTLISGKDALPNFPAKNVGGKVSLPLDGIPGECEISLRRVTVVCAGCCERAL